MSVVGHVLPVPITAQRVQSCTSPLQIEVTRPLFISSLLQFLVSAWGPQCTTVYLNVRFSRKRYDVRGDKVVFYCVSAAMLAATAAGSSDSTIDLAAMT